MTIQFRQPFCQPDLRSGPVHRSKKGIQTLSSSIQSTLTVPYLPPSKQDLDVRTAHMTLEHAAPVDPFFLGLLCGTRNAQPVIPLKFML